MTIKTYLIGEKNCGCLWAILRKDLPKKIPTSEWEKRFNHVSQISGGLCPFANAAARDVAGTRHLRRGWIIRRLCETSSSLIVSTKLLAISLFSARSSVLHSCSREGASQEVLHSLLCKNDSNVCNDSLFAVFSASRHCIQLNFSHDFLCT